MPADQVEEALHEMIDGRDAEIACLSKSITEQQNFIDYLKPRNEFLLKALKEIYRWNDHPGRYDPHINEICEAAINAADPEKTN